MNDETLLEKLEELHNRYLQRNKEEKEKGRRPEKIEQDDEMEETYHSLRFLINKLSKNTYKCLQIQKENAEILDIILNSVDKVNGEYEV
ncbi:MAG TPA: hypothetical protein VIK72_15955 [Clostridiaceae bacterium]